MTASNTFNANEQPCFLTNQRELQASQKVPILNGWFDAITLQQTVDWGMALVQAGERGYICTVNVAILMMMPSNECLQRFIAKAALTVADGQPIVWLSRWLHQDLPERVSGVDLIDAIAARAERAALGIYLLGGTQEVAAKMAARLTSQYPGLTVHFRNGYFPLSQADECAQAIRQSGAHILFVGMGVPRQEIFLDQTWSTLGVNLAIGVGGSFEVLTGFKKRAPQWMQAVGLEWLYRLVQEPRRLFKRYLVTNTQFLYELLRLLLLRRAAR